MTPSKLNSEASLIKLDIKFRKDMRSSNKTHKKGHKKNQKKSLLSKFATNKRENIVANNNTAVDKNSK